MSNMKHRDWKFFLIQKFNTVWEMKEVARKMGVPYSTLHNYTYEDTYWPKELDALLYNATKDRDIFNFSLRDTVDLALTTHPDVAITLDADKEALDLPGALGRIFEDLKKVRDTNSSAGKCLSLRELASHVKVIEILQKEVEEYKQAIIHGKGKND